MEVAPKPLLPSQTEYLWSFLAMLATVAVLGMALWLLVRFIGWHIGYWLGGRRTG